MIRIFWASRESCISYEKRCLTETASQTRKPFPSLVIISFPKAYFAKKKSYTKHLSISHFLGLEPKRENQVGKVTNAGQLKSDIS